MSVLSALTENLQWPEPKMYDAIEPQCWSTAFLPAILERYVACGARQLQVSPEAIALPLLSSLGAALGSHVRIMPKGQSAWMVTPNLWCVVITSSGQMKSPSLNHALAPARAYSDALRQDSEREIARIRSEIECLESAKKSNRRGKKQSPLAALDAVALALPMPKIPPLKLLIVNDATPEALVDRASTNPRGLILTHDELSLLIGKMATKGYETLRAILLTGGNGMDSFTVERIGRGSTFVGCLCLSVVALSQPSVIRSLHKAALKNDGDDGLLPRFQLLAMPRAVLTYMRGTIPVDKEAQSEMFDLAAKIGEFGINEASVAFTGKNDDGRAFSFDERAQQIYFNWEHDLQSYVRRGLAANAALAAHLSKSAKTLASLALIFECSEDLETAKARRIVSVRSLEKAISLIKFLYSHASAFYDGPEEQGFTPGRLLAGKILSGAVEDGANFRGVHRRGWSELKTSEQLSAACVELEERGWLRLVTYQGGQRSMQLNPSILKIVQSRLGYHPQALRGADSADLTDGFKGAPLADKGARPIAEASQTLALEDLF